MLSFVNVKKSSFQLTIDYKYGAGKITAASTLPGVNVRGPVKKGQRIFDWQNALKFSLFPAEASKLIRLLKANKIPENGFSIQHSPTGNFKESVTALFVSVNLPYVNLTVSKDHNLKITYGLKEEEIHQFMLWLEEVARIPLIQQRVYYITSSIREALNKQKGEINGSDQSNRYSNTGMPADTSSNGWGRSENAVSDSEPSGRSSGFIPDLPW